MAAPYQPGEIFEMTEREHAGAVVLALAGELDFGTMEAVQQRLRELRKEGRPVVLDLDGLTFMDSTGIRLVLTAVEDAQAGGWSFRVTRGSAPVRQLLDAARVSDRLPYADDAGA